MSEYIEYFFFNLISALVRRLSFRAAGRVGSVLGRAVFSLTNFRKEITIDNLRQAFPEWNERMIRDVARGAYRNYGIAMVESLWAKEQPSDAILQVVRLIHPEVLRQALDRGKGVLLLSAHYGSWEFLVPCTSWNFNVVVGSVVQRQRNQHIDKKMDASRSRFGNFTIPMGVASRRVLTTLAEKKVVILLGDQSGPKEALFVEFFGRPAATHRGVAAFSMKTGAPIVMAFLVRQPDGTYTMTFEEVDLSGLGPSSEEAIAELTRRHVAVLEKWIRLHPDHWLWMHKRWKHTQFFESQHLVEESI